MFEIRIAGKENKDTTRVHRASWEEIEGEILRKRRRKEWRKLYMNSASFVAGVHRFRVAIARIRGNKNVYESRPASGVRRKYACT